jgi:hypothetical protein
MPRSTRHSTRQKMAKDQKLPKVEPLEDDSTNIKTTSTSDLLVDNYNLHFELTDLETLNTASNNDNDNEHSDRVQVERDHLGLGSDNIVSPTLPEDHDRNGSGGPEYPDVNNQPGEFEENRLKSTSPVEHHQSYPPHYLEHHEYPYDPESESASRKLIPTLTSASAAQLQWPPR